MTESLPHLRARRGHIKGAFTRLEHFVSNPVSVAAASVSDLEARRSRLVSAFKDYEDINVEITILDPNDDEQIEIVETKYYTLMAKLSDCIKKSDTSNDVKNSSKDVSMSKLPNIEISTYDGKDFTQFKPFMDLFTALIDNNKSLSDIQKLFYLRKYLQGEALSVIVNLPMVNESYPEALTLLKKRFDNKARLISNHINHLLDLPPMQKGTASSIRAFISEVQQQIYALKNLEQPTKHWDMLLISILSRKLDSYTYRAYHLERQNPDNLPTMDEFVSYLERRAIALEDSPALKSTYNESARGKSSPYKVSNVAAQDTPKQKPCIYCNKGHPIYLCPAFQTAAIGDRIEFAKSQNLCNVCLKPHKNKCKFNFRCKICKLNHNTLMHDEGPNDEKVGNLCNQQSTGNILLPTIRVKLTDTNGQNIYVKAVLDTGSQASLIKKDLVNKLKLPQIKTNTKIVGICNNISKLDSHTNILLHTGNNMELPISCHIVDTITSKLPQQYIDMSNIKLPEGVKLADPDFNVPSEIQLLLGADFYFKIIQNGQINLENGLVLQNTLFGHVIGGNLSFTKTQAQSNNNMVTNFVMQDTQENLTEVMNKFWLAEKIPERAEVTSEFQKAEEIFQNSVQLINNKFHVDMPLKEPMDQLNLGDSFSIALQRFYSLENKFKSHPEHFQLYKIFIDQYIEMGHAKIVDIGNYDVKNDPVYFLTFHGIHNQHSKTTSFRVVFNGSQKSKTGVSLNDKMYNGPTVQNELFDILTLFRTYRYTLMCDIAKMFRNVHINDEQKSLQNILWRDDPSKPVQCLQLQTVTYGLRASTFLSTRCLIELATRYQGQYPLAAKAMEQNTYVDDVICGADDVETLENLKKELISLLELGGFKLHKWCSNVDEILSDIPAEQKYFEELDFNKENIIKTLGVKYDINTDSFTFESPKSDESKLNTKRTILSFIGRIFDPLGLINPVVVSAKIFMQQLWALKIDWDTNLPDEQLDTWRKYLKKLNDMEKIEIKRGINVNDAKKVELIGYSDASLKAFGCCLYLRITDRRNKVHVDLLCSRSRVAPLGKVLTIPQLELNAALILAQLVNKVSKTLSCRFEHKIKLYSDSQIVLAWINNPPKSNTYINNRVKQIHTLVDSTMWGYVSTSENPADCLSRGMSPEKLKSHDLWFHGPAALLDPDFDINACSMTQELPAEPVLAITTQVTEKENCINLLNKYSDINKLERVVAYMLRFCKNCKNPNNKVAGTLTPKELKDAMIIIIRQTQRIYFSKEITCLLRDIPIKTGLNGLHPFLDQNLILRTGGRLQNANNISYDKMHPIIMPKACHITCLIIHREHLRLLHAGAKLVLSSLSQRYSIVNGIREVKKVLIKCLKCFQLKAAAARQLMGSLPAQRVTAARPFEVTGVDFCGPFNLKVSRIRKPLITKSYIAIFVCFVTKAVHAELVSDLTTETFMACLKRFIARRGVPKQIFCDNAQTFKGTANKLKELYDLISSKAHQQIVTNYCCKNYVKFKFIPSYSPEFGGLWEASVKSLKYHLKRVVGNLVLTFEELYTVITQIEAVLNSRPLLPMSAETSDYRYLTPSHFLIGTPLTSLPEDDHTDININRLKFWKVVEKLKQEFWKLWSKDYLTQLQNRPKWQNVQPNLKEGDLVIVKIDNNPSLTWPMARVVKTYPGRDGRVRVADVKMGHNGKIYNRSLNKLCPLPLND